MKSDDRPHEVTLETARPGDLASTGPGPPGGMSRRRKVALAAVVIGSLLSLVVATIGYVAYDRATKIDRSSPTVVLRQYLYAQFSHAEADGGLFTCGNPAIIELAELSADISAREQQFNLNIEVGMENSRTEILGAKATVSANIVLVARAGAVNPREVQRWEFTFVEDDGWRLCGARRR